MDEKTMYKLTYGLFVLTSKRDGRDNGCIVNTAGQVTSSPNRISVAVNKQNLTHDFIRDSGEFNISILSEKAPFETFKHWGMQSGHDTDKMVSVEFERSANGIAYITNGANAFLSAKIVQSVDLGSHTLFIADVTDGAVFSEDESATYAFYQKNIKPKVRENAEKKRGYICTVCGYIYEGDPLPDDFICPVCKHPASDFVPL